MKSQQGGGITSTQPKEAACLQPSLAAEDAHRVSVGTAGFRGERCHLPLLQGLAAETCREKVMRKLVGRKSLH